MSDLFHDEVPFDFVRAVFDKMERFDHHTYQVLTKRPERMLAYFQQHQGECWPDHVWAGVSVENQYWADRRIPVLAEIPAQIRFLSVEPLLKAVDLREHLKHVQWVIVGGESGPRSRPMNPEWAECIRDACAEAGVAFFFKQWGGRNKKNAGRELNGQIWEQMPVIKQPAVA